MSADLAQPQGQQLGRYATATSTGLSLDQGMPFNEWRRLGTRLLEMRSSVLYYLGDWRVYGRRFEKDYPDAIVEVDRQLSLFNVLEHAADRVALEVRRPGLSWDHHLAVAALAPAEQGAWLDTAIMQGWSATDLSAGLAEQRPPSSRPPSLTLRAVGELYDLCMRAAERAGMPPADWAAGVLERAAREVLETEVA